MIGHSGVSNGNALAIGTHHTMQSNNNNVLLGNENTGHEEYYNFMSNHA